MISINGIKENGRFKQAYHSLFNIVVGIIIMYLPDFSPVVILHSDSVNN